MWHNLSYWWCVLPFKIRYYQQKMWMPKLLICFNVFSIIFERVSLQCKLSKITLLFHWGDYLIGNYVTSILLRMISKQIRLSGKDAFGINSVIRRLEFSIERKAILSTKTNFIKALSFPKDYYNFVTAWNIRHCS